MKKIALTLIAILFAVTGILAQSPNQFNYQAVLRNADGTIIKNDSVIIDISILQGSVSGTSVFNETHNVITTSQGLINLNIGSVEDLSVINWSSDTYFIQISVNETIMGISQLLSVPYAMHAETASSLWTSEGNNIFFTNGNVGIGSNTPGSKLEVKGEIGSTDDLIFGVLNSNGDTVFAVYQGGVRIYVDDSPESKATGNRGGFAVGGFSSGKGAGRDYLTVTQDSVRIYIDTTTSTKATGNRGGFAVGGFSSGKSPVFDLMKVTADSTRIYVKTQSSKATGNRGGFAVGGFSSGKSSDVSNFMALTPENYFIGHEAGKITTGTYNSFFGYEAGLNNTEGSQGIFIGYKSGSLNTTGNNNTFIGNYAGYNNSTGFENVYLGDSAGASSTTAYWNVFIGEKSGKSNTSGYSNTFVGEETGLYNTTGRMNAYIGMHCGHKNTTGYKNTFVGSYCGLDNTDGIANVFIGSTAGMSNTTGGRNIFIGQASGYYIEEASYNVFIGNQSGAYSIGGDNNVFVGTETGHKNESGNSNTFIGDIAGRHNTTGNENAFFGSRAGYLNTTGNENTFLGKSAGFNNTIGSENTYLGHNAGQNNLEGNRNVFIGAYAGSGEQNSDRLIIENTVADETGALIYGQFDNDSLWFNADVLIKNTLSVERNVGIGTSQADKLLHVAGDARIEGDIYYGTAGDLYAKPDFVFDVNYKYNYRILDIESFINKNNHLPWLTSTKDEKDGINLTRMTFETLEAVENLQLQVIKLKKENENLNEFIDIIKQENSQKHNEINELKTKINRIDESLKQLIDDK